MSTDGGGTPPPPAASEEAQWAVELEQQHMIDELEGRRAPVKTEPPEVEQGLRMMEADYKTLMGNLASGPAGPP